MKNNKKTIGLLCACGLLVQQAAQAVPTVRYLAAKKPDVTELNETGEKSTVAVDKAPLLQTGFLPGELNDNDNDGVINIDDNCPDSIANVAVDGCGCPIAVEEMILPESEITLIKSRLLSEDTVNFELESARLTPNATRLLDDYLDRIDGDKDSVVLEGHCDATGSRAYNLRLSKRRSAAVQAFFERYGVDSEIIISEGLGEDQPRFSNSNRPDRMRNRRVEMQIKHDMILVDNENAGVAYGDPQQNFAIINFPVEKAYLVPNAERILHKLAAYLLDNQGIVIQLVGHSDPTGPSEDENIELSYRRALIVKKYLTELGILPSRMTVKSAGSSELMMLGDTPAELEFNRRVEIIFQ